MLSIYEILLLAMALSMDSFAVSLTSGVIIPHFSWLKAMKMALIFALFQGAMPIFGYFLGDAFRETIGDYDHWIAFLLLALLGGKMVVESFDKKAPDTVRKDPSQTRITIALAVATSIDALAVGVSFAFLKVNIWLASSVIALITFVASLVALCLGKKIGDRFSSKAELIGGVILFLLGAKILIQHLIERC